MLLVDGVVDKIAHNRKPLTSIGPGGVCLSGPTAPPHRQGSVAVTVRHRLGPATPPPPYIPFKSNTQNLKPTPKIYIQEELPGRRRRSAVTDVRVTTSKMGVVSKIFGKHYILPFIYYSGQNYRYTDDLSTKGVGFANAYNINKDNHITYGSNFSDTRYNKVTRNEEEIDVLAFNKLLKSKVKMIGLDPDLTKRNVNEGFSGGERKKNERKS